MTFLVPKNIDNTKIYGKVIADEVVAMAKCACVACNSCTCACSCRNGLASEEDLWA